MKQLGSNSGFALVITCILIPLIILTLGMSAFSFIKSNRNLGIKSTCQVQFHSYFSTVRSEIETIETLNPFAVGLFETQMALVPMLWIPSVFKLYQKIQKMRERMEKVQNRTIESFNKLNSVLSMRVFNNIQSKIQTLNKQTRKTLEHNSQIQFFVNPRLQIAKKLNITFPPYTHDSGISEKQRFVVTSDNDIHPRSWMNGFHIDRLKETQTCQGTLEGNLGPHLIIKYHL